MQDTFSRPEDEKIWTAEWVGKFIFSPMERNIGKESILFKKNKKPQFLICKTLFQGLKTKRFGQQNGLENFFFSPMERNIGKDSQCCVINPASKFQVSIVEIIDPCHGRYFITKLQVEHTIFYVINVYSPNDYREQEQFIRILDEKIVSKTDTTKLIISGDWNATPNKIDKWGGLPWK